MGIVLASTAATASAVSPESPETLGKLAGLGALGAAALLGLLALAMLALLVMLIGWVGVLADFQKHGGALRTLLWAVAVLCLPLLGTTLWSFLGRRRDTRVPQLRVVGRGLTTAATDRVLTA